MSQTQNFNERRIFRPDSMILVVEFFEVLFFVFITLLVMRFPAPQGAPWLRILVLLFLVGVALQRLLQNRVWYKWSVRIQISDWGMDYQDFLRRVIFSWEDVSELRNTRKDPASWSAPEYQIVAGIERVSFDTSILGWRELYDLIVTRANLTSLPGNPDHNPLGAVKENDSGLQMTSTEAPLNLDWGNAQRRRMSFFLIFVCVLMSLPVLAIYVWVHVLLPNR